VKTVPGVRESIEQGEYPQAESEIARASGAISRLADLVNQASADLEGSR
jgi:hypothetical protein